MSDATTPWQLFPDLADDEYEALKQDIAERGVLVPVEYDDTGAILDGHHRVRACRELGIKDWPTVTRGGMDDDAKLEHVLRINNARRHLTAAQKREAAVVCWRAGWTQTRTAAAFGVTQPAVAGWYAGYKDLYPDDAPDRVEGADGKAYPATIEQPTKPKPSPSIFTTSTKQQDRAATALRDLGDDAPAKNIDVKRAEKMVKTRHKAEAKQQTDSHVPDVADCDLRSGDFRTALHGIDGTVDAIITDPPYPREFIPLLTDLSETAARILKPGGICAVMMGQSYLPEAYERLTHALDYQWTIAYLTPGGQATQLWDRKVNTFWKPVIVLTNGEPASDRWYGDVSRSDVNDNDKHHHHWGQSESGTADLVERLTTAGQLVCDPFVGGGTTAAVAIRLGRRFVGAEIESDVYDQARARVAAEVAA